tara:strand:- start:1798 stop:2727 length:930 start_codon:yes stop_codon:yes gene_type:complete
MPPILSTISISLFSLIMPLLHIEHLEDTVLNGNLSALELLENSSNLTAKIDGSPSIVWGQDPADNLFFVGTKSVFNKKLVKRCKSYGDVNKYYKGELADILTQCFRYLPNDGNIYQGDFIGLGGLSEYNPNTVTYTFDRVIREDIIIAPHTTYVGNSKDLREHKVLPLTRNLQNTNNVRFVSSTVTNNNCMEDLTFVINFARTIAGAVEFIEDPKNVAAMKKELNAYIREDREIVPEEFDNTNLVRFYNLVIRIKEQFMDNCNTNSSEMKASLNGEDYDGEGYVLSDKLQTIKLINRREFSYNNFIRNS